MISAQLLLENAFEIYTNLYFIILIYLYKQVFFLPCLSKKSKKKNIQSYNRLYKHLKIIDFVYSKRFGFQEGYSTEHAIIQMVDQIMSSFGKDKFTLRVFIDFSKAFDTVDDDILSPSRLIKRPQMAILDYA